mmetsp:Transcript_18935/g.36811  ORF Transcript_18935/g.36811 Transcript_18935/m.36811 type:complete len:215 (+) Transcript_18935:261-905(+)
MVRVIALITLAIWEKCLVESDILGDNNLVTVGEPYAMSFLTNVMALADVDARDAPRRKLSVWYSQLAVEHRSLTTEYSQLIEKRLTSMTLQRNLIVDTSVRHVVHNIDRMYDGSSPEAVRQIRLEQEDTSVTTDPVNRRLSNPVLELLIHVRRLLKNGSRIVIAKGLKRLTCEFRPIVASQDLRCVTSSSNRMLEGIKYCCVRLVPCQFHHRKP